MQTNEQGDVILNIGANVKKAKAAMNDLSRSVNDVFKAFKGQSISSPQLDKLKAQADQSMKKIEALKRSISDMQNSFTEKPTAQMQKLIDKENELEAAAKKVKDQITNTNPAALNEKYAQQYEKIRGQIEQVTAQQIKLTESGKAFTTVAQDQPKAFEKANEQLRQEQSNLAGIKAKMDSVNDAGEKASSNVGKRFKSMSASVAGAFRKIRSHAKSSSNTAAGSFGNLNDAVKKGVKMLVKYGLGVRSLFILWRKLRSAVVDSYKDLATYSTEVNQSIVNVKSAVSKLKNAVAAAVQPLITAFAPLVTSLANKLTSIMETVGKFFAALTGQDYVYQAVDVQEQYADALSDTADSAKDAAKAMETYLSPLDDINRYTVNSSSSSSNTDDAAATTTKFTSAKVDNAFKDLANRIKGYFSDLFQPVKAAWAKYGKPVMMEWKRLVDNVKSTIAMIADSFRRVWTNGSGERAVGNILKLWKSILRIINSVIEAFKNAWNKDMLGDAVIQSFIDRFNNLLELIRDVADTFSDVWNDGTGERIWTNILTTVRNINDIIGGFWKRLKKAWDENGTGKKIWQDILGIVEDVTGWFKDLSEITFDWIEDLDLSPVVSAFEALLSAIRNLNKVILDKLKGAYKNVLLPLAKWTIEKAVPTIINLFAKALEFVADVLSIFPTSMLKSLAAGVLAVFAAFKAYKILKSAWEYMKGLKVAFEGLWASLSAHPYAAIVLAIVGAIAAIATAIHELNKEKWETSDLKKSCDEVETYFDDVSEATDNMKSALDEVNNSHIEIKADVTQVEELKDRLIKVIKDGIIDESEMPEYETIINLLNKVDGFEDMWNGMNLETIDGEIHINADEATAALEKFIDKWKVTQWQTALSSDYSSLYSSLGANKRNQSEMKTKAQEAYNNLYTELSAYYEKYKNSIWGSKITKAGGVDNFISNPDNIEWMPNDKFKDLFNAYTNANSQLREYQTTQDSLTRSLNDNWEAQKFLNGETDNYVGALYAVDSGLISEADAMELLKDTGVNSYSQLQAAAKEQQDTMADASTKAAQTGAEIAESANKTADNAEKNNMRMLEGSGRTYAGMKEASGEWHTAQNQNQDDTAANAEKNAEKTKNGFVSAFSGIRDKASELWEKLKSLFSGDSGIGKGIANFAITGINQIIQCVNDAIRTIVGFINNGLSGIRNFKILGNTPFSWLPTLTPPQIPEIPALARGAVLPAGKPFLTMLGDQKNGNNLEAPESLMRQIVREETGNNQPITAHVNIDGKNFFDIVIENGRAYARQTGHNPFTGSLMGGAY